MTWLRERRVAHAEILRLYLERVAGEGLRAFTDAEQAWGLLADREALDKYLRSLELERLEDVISSLEAYEDQFATEHVEPTSIVLLNLLPELPKRDRGFFSLRSDMVVGRVVYRLVRTLETPDEIERAVGKILPEVASLSAKHELIRIVGHRENAGQKPCTGARSLWGPLSGGKGRRSRRARYYDRRHAADDPCAPRVGAKRGTEPGDGKPSGASFPSTGMECTG